jgi:four helix bundle protein
MAESVLRDKSLVFAKEIISLCAELKGKQSVLANQLLRSGTSIGANVHEANYAQSRSDFISKLQIALKECYKTEYWLELIKDCTPSDNKQHTIALQCGTLRRLLISSINTAKKSL